MTDHATPNLPSRDFEVSSRFYGALGFAESWRDGDWMILERGTTTLEFFPHPHLDPLKSWFSCCLRVDDLEAWCRIASEVAAGEGLRYAPPRDEESGIRIAHLIDPDGTLIRLIQN